MAFRGFSFQLFSISAFAKVWLGMALPGASKFEVKGSRFKVRCSQIQPPSPASLGLDWWRSGTTLDIPWYHRPRTGLPS